MSEHRDSASLWLIEQMQAQAGADSLWCSDENTLGSLPDSQQWLHKPRLLTNRYDIAGHAERLGLDAKFNDFDFSAYRNRPLEQIFYRVSKEKPLTHHLINQAARALPQGGLLFLSGEKNQGIKTYIGKAAELFGCQAKSQKNGSVYSAVLGKQTDSQNFLDDSDYTELRPIAQQGSITFHSKPGLFGWQKIDRGSEFLIEQLDRFLQQQRPASLLDLGCGYGYLGLMSAHLPVERRVFTDNNAAALIAADYNCRANGIEAEILAGDAGNSLEPGFDLILCNPPFHQGFSVSGELTRKFLESAHQLLTSQGSALFVVNSFIPLERLGREFFSRIDLLADNGSFKVIHLGR